MNQAIDHGCNWNDGDVLYSEPETATSRDIICRCSLLIQASENTIYYFSMDGTFIDINQLRCPPLADINLPGISCTFACQKNFRHDCASRSSYSLTQWGHFHIFNPQYAKCPTQPTYHWCFTDDRVTSSYILLQRTRNKVRLRLPQWEPPTTGEDLDWFKACGFEGTILVHSSDIQE